MAEEFTTQFGILAENGDTVFKPEDLTKFRAEIERITAEKVKEDVTKSLTESLGKQHSEALGKLQSELKTYEPLKKELEDLKAKFMPNDKENQQQQQLFEADEKFNKAVEEKVDAKLNEFKKALGLEDVDLKKIDKYINDSQNSKAVAEKLSIIKSCGIDESFYDMFLYSDAKNPTELRELITKKVKENPKFLKAFGSNVKSSFDFSKGQSDENNVEKLAESVFSLHKQAR